MGKDILHTHTHLFYILCLVTLRLVGEMNIPRGESEMTHIQMFLGGGPWIAPEPLFKLLLKPVPIRISVHELRTVNWSRGLHLTSLSFIIGRMRRLDQGHRI